MKDYFIVLPEGHDKKIYFQYMGFLKKASGCRPLGTYYKEATYLVSCGSEARIMWGESLLHTYKERPEQFTELYLYTENV